MVHIVCMDKLKIYNFLNIKIGMKISCKFSIYKLSKKINKKGKKNKK